MRLGIVVLKFKSTFFVNVQDMGIQIFVISLMLSAISHMLSENCGFACFEAEALIFW